MLFDVWTISEHQKWSYCSGLLTYLLTSPLAINHSSNCDLVLYDLMVALGTWHIDLWHYLSAKLRLRLMKWSANIISELPMTRALQLKRLFKACYNSGITIHCKLFMTANKRNLI